MTKKFLCMAACALTALVLTSCGYHTHTLSDYEADAKSHWKLCAECGEKAEEGTHELDEMDACTDCGCEVEESDTGTFVYRYDENGNLQKMKKYNMEGVLRNESEFNTIDGETKVSKHTFYTSDGTIWTVNGYDLYGNLTMMQTYNEEGDLDEQHYYEYSLLNADEWYKCQSTELLDDGTKHVKRYDTHGEEIYFANYDFRGVLLYERTAEYFYTEEGDKTFSRTYFNGVLESEITYKTVVAENEKITFTETVIRYSEDGSKTVKTFSENLTIVSETHYDADGNVVS